MVEPDGRNGAGATAFVPFSGVSVARADGLSVTFSAGGNELAVSIPLSELNTPGSVCVWAETAIYLDNVQDPSTGKISNDVYMGGDRVPWAGCMAPFVSP